VRASQARFARTLQEGLSAGYRGALVGGVGYGLARMVIFLSYALMFYVGGYWLSRGVFSFDSMFKIIIAVQMTGHSTENVMQLLPDLAKARAAVAALYAIDGRPSLRDGTDANGPRPAFARGEVVFDDVHFHYPTRPDVPILRGVSFACAAGQSTAIVGASGGGKSSLLALLQRFYDPIQRGAIDDGLPTFSRDGARAGDPLGGDDVAIEMRELGGKGRDPALSGRILVDGVDISTQTTVHNLRSQLAVVEQMPVLFTGTIADNIRGADADMTIEDVQAAAAVANIHDTIAALPDGYETQIASNATGTTQLSGGQLQRVCIARAVARRARVLILDEATAALDNSSEAVVQRALDRATAGSTTLVVAHKLETIRACSRIVVLHEGRVAEEGSHAELMRRGGVYYRLVGHTDARPPGPEAASM
jgi:ABC-type multidrug transport system fused ATPase/permease subunit